MKRMAFLVVFLFATTLVASPQEEADHEELRAMMRSATQALNAHQIDALAPLMAREFVITTVDGQVFRNLAQFKAYIDGLYGTEVQKIEFRPEAAELTKFISADTGLSWGKSTDTYTFKNGKARTMISHWTATVQRQDGHWKLASLHISANVLDNPVIEAAKRYAWMAAGAALLVGLILGFVLRGLTRRTA